MRKCNIFTTHLNVGLRYPSGHRKPSHKQGVYQAYTPLDHGLYNITVEPVVVSLQPYIMLVTFETAISHTQRILHEKNSFEHCTAATLVVNLIFQPKRLYMYIPITIF